MYRNKCIVIAVVLTAVSAELETPKKKCLKLEESETLSCCISFMKLMSRGIAAPKEKKNISKGTVNVDCSKIPPTHTCEGLKCVGKKFGYVSEDGTVIKEEYVKVLETELQGAPVLIEAIKDSCFKGNIADLAGPPEMCEILKINHCIYRQAFLDCTEWDNSESCTGLEDLVKECLKSDP